MRGWRFFIALAATIALPNAISVAQTTGDISGRVTDTSETPLPGVTIEATSPSLPGARVSVTDANGAYRIPAIPPGTYRVRASLPGFRATENNCIVALGSAMTVNLTLRIEAEEKVLVSGETPPIDTSSTATGTSYTADVIIRLPVGRNYADIVRANPGVSDDRGDTEGRFLALSIYGATSAENQWIVDGVNTTNVYKGIQGKAINNEFVQEVEVKTGGYQAEYGRALGGVINVITKSGGNAYHGDTFLYYDSTKTRAEPLFQPDSSLASMRTTDGEHVDYGVDLGGFLIKDRLWVFGAYDRVTTNGHVSRVAPSKLVSRADRFPFDAMGDLYSGKLTWNAAPSTNLVGTVFADPYSTSGAAGADPRQGLNVLVRPILSPDRATWYSERIQGGTDYGLRLTRLFGSLALASAQGSYHRDRNELTADETIRYEDQTCIAGTSERACSPPTEPNAIWGGYGNINETASSRRQYAASVSLYAGDHELKAGGDYLDGRVDWRNHFTGGQIAFLGNEFGQEYYFHRYLAVSGRDLTPIEGDSRGADVLDYGTYLQDSWKVFQGVTINAGLRWDGETTRNYRGRTVLRFDEAWQPRLGVAWDPWRDGKSRIFAFAGRFSYALPPTAAGILFGNFASIAVWNFDPVSLVQDPNVYRHGRRVGGGGAFETAALDGNLQPPYQDELTVGIERMLLPTLTVGLKGTYRSLGRALELRCDLDYTQPETGGKFCALINPGSAGRFASGNIPTCDYLWDSAEGEQCSSTGPATPSARRLYRGLEIFARQSIRDRFWIQASYVRSSLRGNYDGSVNEASYNQSLGQTTPGINWVFGWPPFWHNGYGALALDRPNRFRLDGYWVTPLRVSVGLQAFVESGAPLDRLGYFTGFGAVVMLDRRGSAGRLPTLWEANLTLSYPIRVGPLTATLQGYLYDVFNNQIVTSRDEGWTTAPPEGYGGTIYDPNQVQNNPSYGRVTSRSAPRSFRAALKVAF